MKKLIKCLGILAINVFCFHVYSQEYTPESEFVTVRIENEVEIRRYTGLSKEVRIPLRIGNLPITQIGDLEYIGEFVSTAFGYRQLTNVIISDSITYIGDSAFCVNQLTSIVIPNSVTYIGSNAFGENRLTNAVIGNSVTYIGDGAFFGNQLTSITIGNRVSIIGHQVFLRNLLTRVIIPDSVKSIGIEAFKENQITHITIGSNVSMENNSFDNDFAMFYLSNRMRAGIYIYIDGQWNYNTR